MFKGAAPQAWFQSRFGFALRFHASMPLATPLIDRITDCIPELRRILPFIYETGRRTLQQSSGFGFRKRQIDLRTIWIMHINSTLGHLLAQTRLPTPLCALNNDRPRSLKGISEQRIAYTV